MLPPAARRAVGGMINKASCPTFSHTFTTKTAYVKLSEIQRMQALARMFGTAQPTQAYKLAASLVYADQNKLAGDATINQWNGEVSCYICWAITLHSRFDTRTSASTLILGYCRRWLMCSRPTPRP